MHVPKTKIDNSPWGKELSCFYALTLTGPYRIIGYKVWKRGAWLYVAGTDKELTVIPLEEFTYRHHRDIYDSLAEGEYSQGNAGGGKLAFQPHERIVCYEILNYLWQRARCGNKQSPS